MKSAADLSMKPTTRTEIAESGPAIRACVEAHYPHLLRSVASLFLPGLGSAKPTHSGSGVFVRCRGRDYLFTAAHVSRQRRGHLLVGGLGRFVELHGDWAESNAASERLDDPVDVAIVHIAPETKARLENVEFLQIDDNPHSEPYTRTHRFLAVGYPRSKNKKALEGRTLPAEPWGFITNPARTQTLADKPFIGLRSHIVLEWDGKKALNGEGKVVNPPAPFGISGGPIFDLGDYKLADLLSGRRVHRPTLAAIATDFVSREKAMLGTRLSVLVRALDQKGAWPDR